MEKITAFLATFMKHCFTEADNVTYDLGRIIWGMGSITYLIITFITIFSHHWNFDPIGWGSGFAAIIGGGGAAIAIKSREKD